MVHPNFKGPDIPGYVFFGNSSNAESEADAIAKYSTLGVPSEDLIAIRWNYGTWEPWVVYATDKHAGHIAEMNDCLGRVIDSLMRDFKPPRFYGGFTA